MGITFQCHVWSEKIIWWLLHRMRNSCGFTALLLIDFLKSCCLFALHVWEERVICLQPVTTFLIVRMQKCVCGGFKAIFFVKLWLMSDMMALSTNTNIQMNKLGLSWAKLSPSWDWTVIKIYSIKWIKWQSLVDFTNVKHGQRKSGILLHSRIAQNNPT